ncbi:MAG: sugar phosphate isomerase/epimerase [Anaerolineales bacterium]|nr:sugar phosphate isomerase/epimerase [Anaerolineales bacterium]
MKLGVNSVLFGGFDVETAFKYTAMAGYDGIELMTVEGMADHFPLSRWQELAPEMKRLSQEYGLELLAMEQPMPDPVVMEKAYQAAVEMGVPVINCGPGGKAEDETLWPQVVDRLGELAHMAERYGVTLCCKAHVGLSIYNTPTTLRAMQEISSPAFGVDMDPSHIYRAGENPVEALAAVVSRVKHVHIRDCKGRQQNPGTPAMQANGRGDIDLLGYIRVLHEHGYTGPVDLEIIGTKMMNYSLEQCCIIAAESRGHMQAALQACGAR